MKTIVTAFMILSACMPIGCEHAADTMNLPYQERLVINGLLEAPDPGVKYVIVSRTLPLSETNTIGKGTIANAHVSLAYGDTIAQLQYGNGKYTNESIVVSPGRSYTLFVEWNGKRAWASTTVPYRPIIDTVITVRQNLPDSIVYSAEAIITPREGELYLPWWSAQAPGGETMMISGQPLTWRDAAEDGRIHFLHSVRVIPPWTIGDHVFGCEAYDKPYYDYYISRGDPNFSNVPTYSYFEGPVRWNVHGDGVGLFVAYTYTYTRIGLY